MTVILIFGLIVFLKVLLNIFRLLATKFYYFIYAGLSKGHARPDKHLHQYAAPIGKLFKAANTQILIMERYGSLMYREYISNHLTDPACKEKLIEIFEKTIGVYKLRIRESFYPTFWLFLPVRVAEKREINIPTFLKALLNLVYWAVSFLAGYLLEHYLDSMNALSLLKEFLHNLK